MSEKTGQRLPSERDLAGQLEISRPRLRELLQVLQTEGLVESRRGSGTYAVSLVAGRLRQVAVLIDESLKLGDDPFFSLLLESLQTALQKSGIRCFVERTNGAKPTFSSDGIITLGATGQTLLDAHGGITPFVALLLAAPARPRRKASVLHLNDTQAGNDAARFLWECGCKRITFVGRCEIAAASERLAGAEAFVAGHDCTLDFVPSGLNYSSGTQTGRTLPIAIATGIIAANDWLAAGLWAGLRERGLLPNDFSLVSFDGLPLSDELGICSLAVPIEEIARDAVSELARLSSPVATGRSLRYELEWKRESEG